MALVKHGNEFLCHPWVALLQAPFFDFLAACILPVCSCESLGLVPLSSPPLPATLSCFLVALLASFCFRHRPCSSAIWPVLTKLLGVQLQGAAIGALLAIGWLWAGAVRLKEVRRRERQLAGRSGSGAGQGGAGGQACSCTAKIFFSMISVHVHMLMILAPELRAASRHTNGKLKHGPRSSLVLSYGAI